jgi:peptidoglycan hydrolase-like protein with peptidoglycan-binding domain
MGEQTGTLPRRKAKAKAKDTRATAIPAAYAAIPEAQRLAIQADLALLGDFDAADEKDFEARTIAAIKAYQQRHGDKQTGMLSVDERTTLSAAAKGAKDAVGWQVIDDVATGARIGLPTKLVPQASAARTGSRWTSPHGQIQVETFRLAEAALPALFDEEKRTPRGRSVEHSELQPNSFVIAGTQGLKNFIARAEASGSELRGITVLYDQATTGIMAPVALAIADTFQGFPDPNSIPPGNERSVEYGTAIVVSNTGHLLALAKVTDNCRSITVPGLGHAERIAEAAGLAMLRLYGARNLKPAVLADGDGGDDLTLVGVAAPLAQAGADAVTSVPAHVTGQGIEPVPKLGFAGAAAIDARGQLAGVVDLHASAVADPAALQATLLPAETIRTFLKAQGVAPATGPAATDQSVVRVICVRR